MNLGAATAIAGSAAYLYGAIHNLTVSPGEMGMAMVSWDYEPTVNPAEQIGVFCDGRLIHRLDPGTTTAGLSGLSTGSHSIHVIPIRADDDLSAYVGDPFGSRVYLQWNPSLARDTAAYKIWMKTSPGGTYALLDTVETIRVDEATLLRTSFGGRVSYQGNPPAAINEVLIVELHANGTYDYSNDDGTVTGNGEYAQGVTLHLPFGVTLTAHDQPEFYQSIVIEINSGVQSFWISNDGLPTDTDLYFAVSPVDVAGNEGALSAVAALRIPAMPAPAVNPQWIWDDITETITLAWNKPVGVDSVRVYTNWDSITQTLTPYVIEENPVYQASGALGNWNLNASGLTGVLMAYVRTVSGTLEGIDVTLHTINLPPTPTDEGIILGDVTDFAAVSLAGGRYRLIWSYAYNDEASTPDALHSFGIYAGATESAINWNSPIAVVAAAGAGFGYPVAIFSIAETGTPAAVPRWFGIRAQTVEGIESAKATASFTPDTSAPVIPGTAVGAVQ